MAKIVTTSEVQKEIGQISKNVTNEAYIVTSHGKGKMVILPYFDGCDENLLEYLEDFEMMKKRDILQQKYRNSAKSGSSKLVI